MFLGRTSFDRPVTCAWAPPVVPPASSSSKSTTKLLATATLDGGGVGFGDVDSDFYSKLTLHEIDYSNPSAVLRDVHEVRVHNQRFASLAWGRTGLLAGGMTDGTVKLWTCGDDSRSLKHKADLPAGSSSSSSSSSSPVFVRAVQFHPTATQLAHGGAHKQIKVTDCTTLATMLETAPQGGEVSALAWNLSDAAKHILASGNLDSQTSVWDLRTKKPTCEIRDPRGASVTCVAWSPNAAHNSYHLLIANDSGTLRLFDLRSSTSTPMTEVQATAAGNVGIFDVDWCPQDDSLLVTCSKDNRMLLWDLQTNQVLCEMHEELQQQQQQQLHQAASAAGNRRYEVEWSPEVPGLIAACSFDRSLQLFSVTNTLPRCPQWAKPACRGASFGFGGRLVEFTQDGRVVLSNVHHHQQQQQAAAGDRWAQLAEFEHKLDVATRHDQQQDQPQERNGHLELFCSEQEARAVLPASREAWRVLKVLLADNWWREAQTTLLGYSEEDIVNSAGATSEAVAVSAEEEERAVMRAMTIGRFDVAVDLCFRFNRHAEALYLAGLGGPELVARAQAEFLQRKQQEGSRIMQLAGQVLATSSGQEEAVTDSAGGEDGEGDAWKQRVALLGSFAPPEELPARLNALAATLPSGSGPQTVCYMLARNVSKVGECWSTAIPDDDEFCGIGQVFARVLASQDEFHMDRMMMNRFARLANQMADEGRFDLAKKYAAVAAAVDYEAADLVQRIDYGLVWNAQSEQAAKEEEERVRAQQEEEARIQAEQAALYAQQQAEQQAAYELQQQQQAAAMYAQQQQQQQQYAQQQQYHQQQQHYQQPPPPQHQQQYFQPPPPPPPQQYQAPQQQYGAYAAPPPPQPAAYSAPYSQPPQPAYTAPKPIAPYQPPPAPAPVQHVAPPAAYQPPPPPQQQQQQQYVAAAPTITTTTMAPRVPENDGFGSTAGNANAGAKYGNRTVNAPPATSGATGAGVALRPVDAALQHAVASLQRFLQSLKQRYAQQAPGSMEERRLVEAEKGLAALTASLPVLNDFFQAKLKELAAAMERASYADAHNIQLTLSSSADWKEHKEWIKGLSHLIGVAQKDSQPARSAAMAAPPAAGAAPPRAGGPPIGPPPPIAVASGYPQYAPQQQQQYPPQQHHYQQQQQYYQ